MRQLTLTSAFLFGFAVGAGTVLFLDYFIIAAFVIPIQ